MATTANADDLATQKQQADAAASQAQSQVDASTETVNQANQRVKDAQAQVAVAKQALEDAQQQWVAATQAWQQAQNVQAQKAIELYNANQALEAAQAKVAEGQAKVDAQQSAINAYARSIMQDSSPLVNVAVLLNTHTTATLANRIQWVDTVLSTNQVDLDELRRIEQQLLVDQRAAETAQQAADKASQEADAQVLAAEEAEQQASAAAVAAQTAQDNLLTALQQEQSALDEATKVLSNDQALLSQAQAQQRSIADQIAAEERRIKQAEDEAARKAAAEEQARRAAEEAARNPAPAPAPAPPPSNDGKLSPAAAQSAAYGMMGSYGWNDSQFQCLVWLWNRESGWRWSAENPSSGAYGIPQSLPASKMASVGADYRTNAITQIKWGLLYISQRYGTPCAAWAHSQATNWY